jgi:5,8-dihydroxy-2-naphthoate synthase
MMSQMSQNTSQRTIRVAHSPDSDDAFMFYALATRKIDTRNLVYEHVLSDIETLNQKAMEGEYDVSAISFHAYAYLDEKYALLASGGSVGRNYGPIVVSSRTLRPDQLREVEVAVPGRLTTAFLTLRLFDPEIPTRVVPFDEILDGMASGDLEAGLLIHEGQLSYRDMGFGKVVDLGEWWQGRTGLPLPLGGNIIRRDLGPALMAEIAGDIQDSIQYALDHRTEALEYALEFSRGLDPQRADRFVGMYVNDLTLDYGDAGREGIRTLLGQAAAGGLIPKVPTLDFVSRPEPV